MTTTLNGFSNAIGTLLIVLFCQVSCFGQSSTGAEKPPIEGDGNSQSETSTATIKDAGDSDNEVVINEAKRQLEMLASAEGELRAFSNKNGIKGKLVFDLTLVGKGKVVTVFMVSSNVEVKDQNLIKNKLAELQFPNIRIPKNERVKFRYTLTL